MDSDTLGSAMCRHRAQQQADPYTDLLTATRLENEVPNPYEQPVIWPPPAVIMTPGVTHEEEIRERCRRAGLSGPRTPYEKYGASSEPAAPTWAVLLLIGATILLAVLVGIAGAKGLIWLMGEPVARYAACALVLAVIFGGWRVGR